MILAIDTVSAACSVALIDGERVPFAAREQVGRGHAERLVPMVQALLSAAGDAIPDGIVVDCGPGSFTGVRVGLAAAIGMGMGWDVPVRGFSSLALLAAAVFADAPSVDACAIAMLGGHGELFVQRFTARPFATASDLVSLPPVDAAAFAPESIVAGSGAAALVAARGYGEVVEVAPDAAHAVLLPPHFTSLTPKPIYGRAPDAKPKAA